jgi:hypothetical protein
MPEERSYREPVRKPADHCRFRESLNPAEPGILRTEVMGDGEGEGREHQQPAGAHFHCVQLFRAYLLVERG